MDGVRNLHTLRDPVLCSLAVYMECALLRLIGAEDVDMVARLRAVVGISNDHPELRLVLASISL